MLRLPNLSVRSHSKIRKIRRLITFAPRYTFSTGSIPMYSLPLEAVTEYIPITFKEPKQASVFYCYLLLGFFNYMDLK
jgi:hypothetical protein